ncbi:MAG TPA: ATP-binding protein [candidate division Zixibacteria bacterium]|nr:ATP-binding protein [candidate division Zixibacteria bacterium]
MAKEITIISGKGGTGKTTLTAGLAYLLKKKAIFADADVDAPDLHLILHPTIRNLEDLFISKKAIRNDDLCTQCNLCGEKCRYGAITAFDFNYYKCEGCGLCTHICPENALTMEKVLSAKLFQSSSRFGDFVHVEMSIGEGSSGRIVDAVRKRAKRLAEEQNIDYVIIDGSPGIGCPVIASITGVSLVLIVVEPTLSGIHDLERVLEVTQHFKVPAMVCINKYDLNLQNSSQIENFCKSNKITIAGKIPYNDIVPESIIAGKSVFELPENVVSNAIRNIWYEMKNKLN